MIDVPRPSGIVVAAFEICFEIIQMTCDWFIVFMAGRIPHSLVLQH